MKTLYEKFAGWLWIGERHYWLPLVWLLLSFFALSPCLCEAADYPLFIPVIAALTPGLIAYWGIIIVLVAAIVALVAVALRKFGIAIPDWVQQVFWIIVVAVVIIAAIKFLVSF